MKQAYSIIGTIVILVIFITSMAKADVGFWVRSAQSINSSSTSKFEGPGAVNFTYCGPQINGITRIFTVNVDIFKVSDEFLKNFPVTMLNDCVDVYKKVFEPKGANLSTIYMDINGRFIDAILLPADLNK